jgi:ankyrin repeat protein
MFRPNMQQMVKLLLEHGANPNARIMKGTRLGSQISGSDWPYLGLAGVTPFMLAAASGDVGIMRTLLAKGADPTLGSNDGVTPLMAAAGVGQASQYVLTEREEKQNLGAVKFLVEMGADVNASNYFGYTALHGAAFTGANEIVQFLVDKGASLHAEDEYGQTPLSIAESDPSLLMGFNERAFHPDTAELLRKLGGDPQAHFDETLLPTAPEK